MVGSDMFRLDGRSAMVTGANTGIGQGIAVALARAGADILAVGRSAMTETLREIDAFGGQARPILADLADPAGAAAMLDRAWDEIGPIDILVNNAGITRRGDAVDLAEADWDDVMDINLKAAFLQRGVTLHTMSAVTGAGVQAILELLWKHVRPPA